MFDMGVFCVYGGNEMKIVKVVDRELTAAEIESIEHFIFYTDGVSFACLQERVMAILDDEPDKDVEKLKACAERHMDYALSVMPDIWPLNMDDGYQMVCLPGDIYVIGTERSYHHSPMSGFLLRADGLEACEKGEVIAVVYQED